MMLTPEGPTITHELTGIQQDRARALEWATSVLNDRLGVDADYIGAYETIRLANFIVTGKDYQEPPPERYLRERLTGLADHVIVVADHVVGLVGDIVERAHYRRNPGEPS